MTVSQACDFFEAIPAISQRLRTLKDVGLGYLKLGQQSTTLSGGESQRLKLSAELARRDTGNTLYIPVSYTHLDNGLQDWKTEHQAVTIGIFYCRDSAEINVCGSLLTSSRFDSDVLRSRQQKHTARCV